jgi:hypothetical protein
MKLNLNNYGKKFKFKKREKKEKIISEKDLFIETLDFLEKNWTKSNQAYDLFGINLLEYEESYFKAIENLILLKYGMWKAEIILWYVFGRKDNEGKIYPLSIHNEDESTEEVIIDTPEDLWNILEKISNSRL